MKLLSFVLVGLCLMTLKCAAGDGQLQFQRRSPPQPQPMPMPTINVKRAYSGYNPQREHSYKVKYVATMNGLEAELDRAKDKLVIIVFYVEKCDLCEEMDPMIEELARRHPDVVMLRVNIEKFKEAAEKYEIKSLRRVPVLVFLKSREEVIRFTGATPEDERKIRAHLLHYK